MRIESKRLQRRFDDSTRFDDSGDSGSPESGFESSSESPQNRLL
jgi:hypothetical protein